MDFLLDEQLTHRLIPRIDAAGHTANSVDLLGLKSVHDEDILWLAKQRDWVLVTINAGDFKLLHRAFRRWSVADAHAGILVIPDQLLLAEQVRVLDVFASQQWPTANSLYEWLGDSAGGWVRYDPAVVDLDL